MARFDTEIEVVGPVQLVDAFGELARRFARTAAGGGAPTRGEAVLTTPARSRPGGC